MNKILASLLLSVVSAVIAGLFIEYLRRKNVFAKVEDKVESKFKVKI